MTTGRINQITIFKQNHSAVSEESNRGQCKVVRFGKIVCSSQQALVAEHLCR